MWLMKKGERARELTTRKLHQTKASPMQVITIRCPVKYHMFTWTNERISRIRPYSIGYTMAATA